MLCRNHTVPGAPPKTSVRMIVQRAAAGPDRKSRKGRPPLPEDGLLAEIKAVITDMPCSSYGYARVWAVLRRLAITGGRQPPNRKRVYRVMRVHGLLMASDNAANLRRARKNPAATKTRPPTA